MATPSTNSVKITVIDPSRTGLGKYTIDGEKWGGSLGTGVTLTYSFATPSSVFASFYGDGYSDEWAGITSLTTAEKALARTALAAWSLVANIKFTEVADNASKVGEIRIAQSTSVDADEYAHAYMPSKNPGGGDVWLQADNFNPRNSSALAIGSNDYQTLLHELGHALGLKHTFATPNAIPDAYDNYFYSVMSYSARVQGDSGIASFMPTTPMYYDLLGIQALYGRNTSHNAGNTVYTYVEGKSYFETIDDVSGDDTIAYSGASTCKINLNQGAFSTLSKAIKFDNGSTGATVAIGPNTVIENAIGGAGNDTLTGNASANRLTGGNGNDTLLGNAGNDTLYGSAGNDVLTGGSGNDRFMFNAALSATANKDKLTDFSAADDSIWLAHAVFAKLAAGPIQAANFWTGLTAHDGNDFIVYDKAHGVLYYDSNGATAGGATAILTVAANTALTAADIIIY